MTETKMTCYKLSQEYSLMIALALREDLPNISETIDWQKFHTLVTKNRIQPLVAEGLKKLPAELIAGNDILQKLLSSQNQYTLFNMRQIQTLAFLMKSFSDAGICALSLKGPILAMELYGNPALRYSRDLDILVSKKDLETACRILESHGYTEEITVQNKTPLRHKKQEKNDEEMHRVYTQKDIRIELHWRLSFRIDKSFDELWRNSRTKVLLGQEIHCLGKYDNVSYLISHAAGHGYHRLRWLLDIYELGKYTDHLWTSMMPYMKEQNAAVFLFETILVLYLIPNFPMPEYRSIFFCVQRQNNTVTALYSDEIENDFGKAQKLAEAVYLILINDTDANGIAGRKYNYLLPTLGRKKTVIRSFAEVFEPSKADLELIDLPDSLYFLYYIIRPFHKIWRMIPFSHK